MGKSFFIFLGGIIVALLVAGGFFVARTYLISADPSLTPRDISITRSSPTAGEVSFVTDAASIARIECSANKEGPFSLCGAETVASANHKIRTSVILDPEKPYHFFIKIKNETYDNAGSPFIMPIKKSQPSGSFPANLLGVCDDSSRYDAKYDMNKDGCILQNDRSLYNLRVRP